MTTKIQTFLEVLEEHCSYCPEDMYAVATALLSVENQLDYALKYELEYLLKNYVIAKAREEPDGLGSILNKFPLNIEDNPNGTVEESLTALYNKVIEHDTIPNSIVKQINEITEASKKLDTKEKKDNEEDTKDTKGSVDNNKNVKKDAKQNSTNKVEDKKDKIKEFQQMNNIIKDQIAPPSDLTDQEDFICEAAVAGKASEDGSIWNVRMIVEGHTQSGRYFSREVLKEAMPLFEGARSYMNHPDDGYNGGDRPLNTLVGWYENITLKEGDGLYADWHILANSGIPWLRDQLIELSDKGKLELIGLSLLGLGKNTFKRIDGKVVKYSEGISYVRSVDVVDIPGAGGQVISAIKETDDNKVRREIMEIEGLTVDQLKEANPSLFEEISKLSINQVEEDSKEEVINNSSEDRFDAATKRMEIRECNTILKEALSESRLPQPLQDAVNKQFKDTIFKETDLTEQITTYREAAAAVSPYGDTEGRTIFHLPVITHMITSEERMQASVDLLFGLDVPEDLKDTPRVSGIKEAYLMMTGDYDFSWGSVPLDERIREGAGSTPTASKVVGGGTVTFSNVLGTSMNRRLIRQYQRQNMWWEPFTTIVPLSDLKQQDRNRLESLGSLSERTTGGAEYAELTWAEFVHTYTPTEYGNLVPIAQRAIVDDDLRSLVRVSDEMGRSSGITLNEYVSNLFTQNSGLGPTFQDVDQAGNTESGSETLFKGSTTAEHNNEITSALNRTSFNDAATRIRSMLDKSTKRIGLEEKFLLVPVDLRETGLQIERSNMVPDSANRAVNVYAGTFETIVVPQFTDVNNWYLMSSPDQLDMLEMGFLNGRREPELFVQNDPTAGMNFTHDVVAYKIRHRYGGGWIDYRGSVASIVS